MQKYDFLIIGAGFTGSVFAERIANVLRKKVLIVDRRNHIGGNSFDEYDRDGILVHKYGPHLFHTNNKRVYEYLSRFTEWRKYEHKVLANHKSVLYTIPINRTTLNKYYGVDLRNEKEALDFLEKIRIKKRQILNSEDVIIDKVGKDLFESFFKFYTKKQWALEPSELLPGVCGRIPVRLSDDDRYFSDEYQVIPKKGYYVLFDNILNNKNIKIILNKDYKEIIRDYKFDYIVYTGPVDYYFDYIYGRIPYRSIRFEFTTINKRLLQPVAQINYVDPNVSFTRVVEYKHITGQDNNKTTISYEYSMQNGEPYYPVLNYDNLSLYNKYLNLTKSLKKVIFCGRLAEYRYYNMDQVVARALMIFEKKLNV
jgi:UDP-galactopyranose mutase